MPTDAAIIGRHLAQRGRQAIDEGRVLEGHDLFERAYTVAIMGNETTPMSFKLRPRPELSQEFPQLSSEQHVVAYLD
jgi:hypothetical protein